ncbi:MAG: fibronectin type III domain-containing protein [Thermoplasmatota archaeon]
MSTMSPPHRALLAVLWLVALPLAPLALPQEVGGDRDRYMDESYGRFDWIHPYPTGSDLRSVAWSPDGSRALIVGSSGALVEYDGVRFTSFYTASSLDITDIAWGPDGTHALLTATGGRLLRLEGESLTEVPTGTRVDLASVDISPITGEALVVGEERTILSYDGNRVRTLSSGGRADLSQVAWEPNGSYALIAGQESAGTGTVLALWPSSGAIKTVLSIGGSGEMWQLAGLAFSPVAERAILSANYNTPQSGPRAAALLWNGSEFKTVSAPLQPTVSGAGWLPDGSRACIASSYGLIELDGEGTGGAARFNGSAASALSWRPDGSEALLVGQGGVVQRFDGEFLSTLSSPVVTISTLTAAAWDPKGEVLLAVGSAGQLVTYDGSQLSARRVIYRGRAPDLFGVAWHPSGDYALAVGEAGAMVRYNRDGTIDPDLQSGTVQTLRAVAWHPAGDYAVVVGENGTVRRFSGVASIPVPSETAYTLRGVAFNPANDEAYIVGGDVRQLMGPTGYVKVSYQLMLRYNGQIISPRNRVMNQGPVFNAISFSPAFIACDGGEVRLIEEDGAWKSYNLSSSPNLLGVAWLGGTGDALLTGEGGAAALFNESRRELRLLPSGTTRPITAVALSPRDGAAVCVGWGGAILRYTPNAPPAPVALDLPANVTDSALELSWTASAERDFNRYEVYQSLLPDLGYPRLLLSTTERGRTGLLVTGLTRQTTYYFMVRVFDNAGLCADSNIVRATTLLGNVPPAAVTLYPPSSVTDSSMTLSWSRNNDGDFARYELHMSTSANFTPSPATLAASITDQGTTERSVTGLLPSTGYYFRVRTVDTGGLHNDSNRVNATTAAQNLPPAAPSLSEPTNITESSMRLSWSRCNESDFASYELFMGSESGFGLSNDTRLVTIENQSVTSFTVLGLASNTTYFFRLRVADAAGLWNTSNEVNATTLPPNSPPAPVLLQPPAEVTETTMRLEWSESQEPDFSQYELHGSTQPGFNITESTSLVRLNERGQTSYVVEGLDPNTTRYFKVRVRDAGGLFSDSNEVSATTLPNRPPAAVALYYPFNETDTSMELEWSASDAPDFARYELHRSEVPGFAIEPTTLVAQILERDDVARTVTGLQPSRTYYFRVRVYDAGQLFNDSNEVSGTTLGPDLPPVAPVLADPVEVTEASVLLEWTQNRDPDFARYIVHRGAAPGFPTSNATAVASIPHASTTSYNATGLKPATTYYFKIEVQDIKGHFNLSNEVRARTLTVNVPPLADAGQDRTATVGERVYFWAFATDADGYVTTYEWDFDADGTWDYSGANGNTSFIYEAIGLYEASLRVTDDRGGQGLDTVNVTVEPAVPPNIPPIILDAGEGVQGYIGDEIAFSGNATDPDGYIIKYEWDFDGDGVFDFASSDGANTTHIYSELGAYTAVLRATDERGGVASAGRAVEILRFNNAPEARIDSPRNGQSFYSDELVTLDGRSSYDPDGDTLRFAWESVRDGKRLGTSSVVKTTLARGNHTLRLTVSDGELSASAEVSITVKDRPNQKPTVRIDQPLNNTLVRGVVTISGSSRDDRKVEKVELRIDPTGTWQKASGTRFWSYELDTRSLASGLHTIYVRAYDGEDYSSEAVVKINIQNPVKEREEPKGFVPAFGGPLAAAALIAAGALLARRRRA